MAVAESTKSADWPAQQESFGHLLRSYRKARGLGQKDLGVAVDRDYTYISKLETGTQPPQDPDEVLRLAVALRLTSTEADELLHALPRFATVRFRTDMAPFSPAEDQIEATWLNMLTRIMQVYAVERQESAEQIAAHLATFASVPVLIAFVLDPKNEPHRARLKRLLLALAQRDVRTAALMVLRNAVLLPLSLDSYQRRKHRIMLSVIISLTKRDAATVDLAFRDVYSASLTQAQRDALRRFRAEVERRAPKLLSIELPTL